MNHKVLIKFNDAATLIRDGVNPNDIPNVPYIGLEHIEEGTLRLIGIGNSKNATSTKFRFSKGDILFGKLRPYFRKVIRPGFDGICSTDIWVVRAREGIDQRFLYYWMASEDFVNFATQGSEGTKMPRAKWEHVGRFQRRYLPENEQRAIAHILGSLDDKIELNRRMNETLEQMARAIFKSWFVDFVPVRAKAEGRDPGLPEEIAELFPDGFEESEIGEVPRGWEVVRLPDIVKKYIDNRGKTPPTLEDGIPLLEVKHLPDNQMKPDLNTSKYVSEETYDSWFRSHLKSYDIILSTVGTIGRICIVPPNSKFVIAQNLLGIRFNDEFVTPIFMYYQMSSEKFKNDVDARLVITVQKSIKRKDLITIPLLKPPLNIQRAFDRMVSSNVLFQLSDENITLSKIRDTLLPKLISGELRVPDAENLVLESTI